MKPHLSWSQISQYNLCPRAYRLQRIDKLPSAGSPAAYTGKTLHAAVEHNFKQKIQSGNDLPVDVVTDYFAEVFENDPERAGVRWAEAGAGMMRDGGVAALRAFMQSLAPRIQPAAVEERHEISLGDDFPFTLVCIFDVRTVDDRILDNKFFSRMKSQADVDADGQLDCYALAYRIAFGRPERGLGMAIATRAKSPRTELIQTTRTNAQIQWRIQQIEEIAQAILAGVFPRRDDGWKHSPEWCEFWGHCVQGSLKDSAK